MRYFAQFIHKNQGKADNSYRDACGSDGVFQLDGRKCLTSMKLDCLDRMKALRQVQSYDGFIIRKGNLLRSSIIHIHLNSTYLAEKES